MEQKEKSRGTEGEIEREKDRFREEQRENKGER
jgi:hypothetical protein